MQARGRSRQISPAAEARRASEERLRRRREVVVVGEYISSSKYIHSNANSAYCPSALSPLQRRSPCEVYVPAADNDVTVRTESQSVYSRFDTSSVSSPVSIPLSGDVMDYDGTYPYDTPPSPPRTIADAIYVAYANDDMQLAKILLLKLKGILVSSDDDPRIGEVRDEDFDTCFLPEGPVLSEDEQGVQGAGHITYDDREEQQRGLKISDNEELRLRQEQFLARQQCLLELDREQHPSMKKLKSSSRALLSGSSSHLRSVTPPYDSPRRRIQFASSEVKEVHSMAVPCPVTFEEVYSSVNGALFPSDVAHVHGSSFECFVTKGITSDALGVLIDEDNQRYPLGRRSSRRVNSCRCLLCSTTDTMGGFTFPGDSHRSIIGGTCDDSSVSSAAPGFRSDMLLSDATSHVLCRLQPACCCPTPPTRLVAVTDHPLTESQALRPRALSRSLPTLRDSSSGGWSLGTSHFDWLFGVAKSVYMSTVRSTANAAVFRSLKTSLHSPFSLRPEGYRATAELVDAFLSKQPIEPEVDSMVVSLDGPRRTVLRRPLPYKTYFEPQVVPTHPPLHRFFHQMRLYQMKSRRREQYYEGDPDELGKLMKRPYTGACSPQQRLQIIGNPVYMRLQALRGVAAQQGERLVIYGLKKGALVHGTEKISGVATEWRRKSRLCVSDHL